MADKSTQRLWTDAGVDQNFQRDLGVYEFQALGALFSGNVCMDQWPWKFVKSFP